VKTTNLDRLAYVRELTPVLVKSIGVSGQNPEELGGRFDQQGFLGYSCKDSWDGCFPRSLMWSGHEDYSDSRCQDGLEQWIKLRFY
jgi:hypothetical protein